jgi:hypothetical protein
MLLIMPKSVISTLLLHVAAIAMLGVSEHQALSSVAPSEPAKAPLKYEWPRFLTGSIYSSETKELLFTFKRTASRSGSTLKVEREFTYPNGKPATRERVLYDSDGLVAYELEELQLGAVGAASIRRTPGRPSSATLELRYAAEQGAKPKTRSEAWQENTLIADMVGPFLADNFTALSRGDTVSCRYIVPDRKQTVGFIFIKQRVSTYQGQQVLVVKMEPRSVVIKAMVDPLFFTIEEAPPHRVLQYTGRTAPKVRTADKWKDLDALTVFDWASAR